MTLILWAIIGLLGVYVLFLGLSPLLVASMQVLNPGPRDKRSAIENGKYLITKSHTVVAVGAHPDDIEWYAGGTLAALESKGVRIIVIMVTDGGKLREQRAAEQLEAARIIGYKKVIFLGYPDGSLKNQPQDKIADRIENIYKQYKPDSVITFDPSIQGPIYHHQDHIAAGRAAVSAAKGAGVEDMYLFHSGAPNTWIDVSQYVHLKERARAAHKTQTKWFLAPFGMGYIIKEAAWIEGRKAGLKYAESFRKL